MKTCIFEPKIETKLLWYVFVGSNQFKVMYIMTLFFYGFAAYFFSSGKNGLNFSPIQIIDLFQLKIGTFFFYFTLTYIIGKGNQKMLSICCFGQKMILEVGTLVTSEVQSRSSQRIDNERNLNMKKKTVLAFFNDLSLLFLGTLQKEKKM